MLFFFPAGSRCCWSPQPASRLPGAVRKLEGSGREAAVGRAACGGAGPKGTQSWQLEDCWRGEQFNMINSLAVYWEQAVCTLRSTTGHYTGLFPALSDLVTDAVEKTDTGRQFLSKSKWVRLFARSHRSYTNSLCMETTESVQTVRILPNFLKGV